METWHGHLEHLEVDSYVTRIDFLLPSEEERNGQIVEDIKAHLRGLHEHTGSVSQNRRVSEIHSQIWALLEELVPKFHQERWTILVELASERSLKLVLREKSMTEFLLHVQSKYPGLAGAALEHLLSLRTTFNYKIEFPAPVDLKTKKRNQMDLEAEVRLRFSSFGTRHRFIVPKRSSLCLVANRNGWNRWSLRSRASPM
jgi:hypothetical protein